MSISHEHKDNMFSSIKRFENMLKNNETFFFDIEFYEDIIAQYHQKHNIENVLLAANKGLEQHPFSTELKFEKAQALYVLGHYEEAMDLVTEVLSMQPGEFDCSLLQSNIYLAKQMFQEALATIQNISIYSSDEKDRIHLTLGRIYQGLGDFEQAYQNFKISSELNPDNKEALIELASTFGSEEDLQEGIEIIKQLLEQNPFDFYSWYNLGTLQDKAHLYEDAIDSFEYVTSLENSFAPAHYNKGLCFMSLEKYEDALYSLNETLNIEGEQDIDLLINIAGCELKLGNNNSAARYYKKIIDRQPVNHIALSGLGICLYEQEKWSEALHFISRAVKVEPEDIFYLFTKADTEYLLGNNFHAIEDYKKIVTLAPDYADAWINLSIVYTDICEYEESTAILKEALENCQENSEVIYRIAASLILEGNYKEAFIYLENALILDFEKHIILFEIFPELETQKALIKIIDQYKD